jgi:drug/metabolite transporter (DMT)-like permease
MAKMAAIEGSAPVGVAMRENLRGILAMMTAMFALTCNFAFVKLAGASLPVGEILFLRGLVASILLAIAIFATGTHRHFRALLHRTVLWRTIFESSGAALFVTALMTSTIADVTILLQAMPLTITAGAALWLGEKVNWRRWAAVAVGFVGVLIVVRPGLAAFQWASLLVLSAVLLSTLRDLTTRRMPEGAPTMLVAIAAVSALSLVGLSLWLFEHWKVPDGRTLFQVAGSGSVLSLGLFFIVSAMRRGELSIIAPFRYSAVLWAILLGYLLWGEAPDPPTIIGALVIVASGVYISYRERKVRTTVPFVQTDAAAEIIRTQDRGGD